MHELAARCHQLGCRDSAMPAARLFNRTEFAGRLK